MGSILLFLGCSMTFSLVMGISIAAYELRHRSPPAEQNRAVRTTRVPHETCVGHPIARRRKFARAAGATFA